MPRRRLLAVVLGVVVLGLGPDVGTPIGGIGPGSTAAQDGGSEPTLSVTPDCLPPTGRGATAEHRLEIRGGGFAPNSQVRIVADGGEVATVDVDALGAFRASPVVVLAGAVSVLTVAAETIGGGPASRTRVTIPCFPRITLTPDCGGREGSPPLAVTVAGSGFAPGREVIIGIRELERELDRRMTGSDGTFEASDLALGELSAGDVTIIAIQPTTSTTAALAVNDIRAVAPLEVPCPAPSVRIVPVCESAGAPPDRWTIEVVGSGFHPGSLVVITFDRRGSFEVWTTKSGRSGEFRHVIRPYQRPGRPRGYVIRVENPAEELAARVATTRLRVPCPPVATPTPRTPASISASSCGQRPDLVGRPTGRYRVVVDGAGFVPGAPVTITFDPAGAAESTTVPADVEGRFNDVVLRPARRPIGMYVVEAVQSGSDLAARGLEEDVRAETAYRVPCAPTTPDVPTLDPDCGRVARRGELAYEIAVEGSGFHRGASVVVSMGEGENPDRAEADADEDGAFRAILVARGRPEGDYAIRAVQNDTAGAIAAEASAVFGVPCPFAPSITLEPETGPPGYTTLVVGVDFPPGEPVELRWDRGLDASRTIEVVAGPDGRFESYILILPRDFLGRRTLSAETPRSPGAYPDLRADFVVTAGQGAPADPDRDDFIVRR